MKTMMKRLFFCFLAFLFLFLSACSRPNTTTKEPANNNQNETKTEETNPYSDAIKNLINEDFGGTNFRIATDSSDLISNANGQSLGGKEYYLRNRAVEEKYNIKITLTDESGLPTIVDRIKTEALAGADYCDLVLLRSDHFQSLASSETLLNSQSVPYLNLNSDYYFQNSITSTTLGNTTYGFAGDFTMRPEDCYCVFFNKDLLSKTSLPDLYKLVNLNQWDLENFLLYSEEVYSLGRVNGVKVNGFMSSHTQEELIHVFWAGTGFDFLYNNYGERPELIYNHNDTRRFISAMQNLLFVSEAYESERDNAITSFAAGESLFLIEPLSCIKKLVGQNANFGIVPIPKLDINQTSYYTYLDGACTYAGFSKGTKDLSKSGMITAALFCASKELNQNLKIQTYLNQYLSSPEDAKMMMKVMDSPYYDAVEFFGQTESSYKAATQTLLYRTISSEGDFDRLYTQYEKMLDKFLDSKF